MIEGRIEAVTEEGMVEGWIRDTGRETPCRVQVRRQGLVLAEALAGEFRAALLAAGRGHGWFGFHARLLHSLPPGPADLELFLPQNDRGAVVTVVLPEMRLRERITVEHLLDRRPGWTEAELLPRLACLELDRRRTAFGTARFIDRAYRFALDRWPSRDEALVYGRELESARLSPEGFLAELLRRRAHEDTRTPLAGPHDQDFALRVAAGR